MGRHASTGQPVPFASRQPWYRDGRRRGAARFAWRRLATTMSSIKAAIPIHVLPQD
ncbi:hypothetical protein [Massilia sp. YMA4]|uniref:hypothetical protein n=1 Tax=Massilia sp. YMA4 TaxID=1593482 RepID=UPI001878B328|nr:hypothetical protein [Massilia sp. YMA4]